MYICVFDIVFLFFCMAEDIFAVTPLVLHLLPIADEDGIHGNLLGELIFNNIQAATSVEPGFRTDDGSHTALCPS